MKYLYLIFAIFYILLTLIAIIAKDSNLAIGFSVLTLDCLVLFKLQR